MPPAPLQLHDLEQIEDDELPPLSPPRTISRDAMDAALATLRHREQAAWAGHDDDDEDGKVEDVVVARNVTPDDLDRVPRDWCEGFTLALDHDGTLIAVSSASHQRSDAFVAVYTAVHQYAARHGLECAGYVPLNQSPGGRFLDVDVLLRRRTLGVRRCEPLVVLEIVMPCSSIPWMITRAAACFAHDASLQRVVCVKLLAPQTQALARGELWVPAFVVAFRRGDQVASVAREASTPTVSRLRPVHVEQLRAMGNAPLPDAVLAPFLIGSHHPLIENPLATLMYLGRSAPEFPNAFDMTDLPTSLADALATAQWVAQPFAIPMPASLPPIRIDLPNVFIHSISGWAYDRTPYVDRGLRDVAEHDVGDGDEGVLVPVRRGDWTVWSVVSLVLRRLFGWEIGAWWSC